MSVPNAPEAITTPTGFGRLGQGGSTGSRNPPKSPAKQAKVTGNKDIASENGQPAIPQGIQKQAPGPVVSLKGNGHSVHMVSAVLLLTWLRGMNGEKDVGGGTLFTCKNGKNIAAKFKCDGHRDCDDGSDEQLPLCRKKVDAGTLFACMNNQTIPSEWQCDGLRDCDDDSDEQLPLCQEEVSNGILFACMNKQTILSELQCNGYRGCDDFSDEQSSGLNAVCFNCDKPGGPIAANILLTKHCDGTPDCPNGFDELNCMASAQSVDNNTTSATTSDTRADNGNLGLALCIALPIVAVAGVAAYGYSLWRHREDRQSQGICTWLAGPFARLRPSCRGSDYQSTATDENTVTTDLGIRSNTIEMSLQSNDRQARETV